MPLPVVPGMIRNGLRQVPGGSQHVESRLFMHQEAGR